MRRAGHAREMGERLHVYLKALPPEAALPTMATIGKDLKLIGGAYDVCSAFDSLAKARIIEEVHGSRSVARGHRIVRLRDGRVFKTDGCPLTLPAKSAL